MINLSGRDIIAIHDLSLDEITVILDTAQWCETNVRDKKRLNLLSQYVLATLFFEPSTRTRLSFETAMHRLGGQVITVADPRSSSAAKGESLADTVRTVEQYADVIVLRHPVVGSAQEAADAVHVPVLNAGDGAGQHPTQALLDLYTLRRERGQVDGLHIALVGDLKHGRTVHSLVEGLAHYDVRLTFVSPPALAMPAEMTSALRERGVDVVETDDLAATAAEADVLYVTRIQRERFADPDEYQQLKGVYRVDADLLAHAKAGLTIMHPLPRVDEISPEVDDYPGAAYFRQATNGVFVRMALLALVLGEVSGYGIPSLDL